MADPQLGDRNPVVEDEENVVMGAGVDPTALAGEWRDWMAEPGNRQAIMQFGINLMQPMGVGQSVAGHFGQAVGAAGEAVDRYQSVQRQESELDRKQADTASRLNERAGKLSQGEVSLGLRQQREDTRAAEVKSKIETAERRAKLWDEQAVFWAAKARAEPGNAEASQKLKEAQTKKAEAEAELKGALTTQVPRETDIRERRVETGEKKLELDEQFRREKMTNMERQFKIQEARIAAQLSRDYNQGMISAGKLYQDEMKQRGIMERGFVAPPFAEWIKKFNVPGQPDRSVAPTGGTPSATPAPGPQQTKPPATTPTSAGQGSPVGTPKTFTDADGAEVSVVKIKPGPDSDRKTWSD